MAAKKKKAKKLTKAQIRALDDLQIGKPLTPEEEAAMHDKFYGEIAAQVKKHILPLLPRAPSRRERIATEVLAGLVTRGGVTSISAANDALSYADALIAAHDAKEAK